MNKKDSAHLIEQIRNIILSKPITDDIKLHSKDDIDLQDALDYLSKCLLECNDFLNHLRLGDLDVQPPGKHNFLAGNLKELHAALRHLTWQSTQVANGDYNQKVSFLGDFSSSFNQLIQQLNERESQLKKQSNMLSQMLSFMESIMDGLNDWIIVTSKENGKIVYTNSSAKKKFYDAEGKSFQNIEYANFFNCIQHFYSKNTEDTVFEYSCDCDSNNKQIFRVHSYTVQWNEQPAYAHYIVDATAEKAHQEQMKEMAYKDALTGLYNRRFCLEKLSQLIDSNIDFSFCMIDLDGLKYANDNFGHSAGDSYLIQVTNAISQITRSTDIVCRLGGDEISVLFLNCKESIIINKLEHLNYILAKQSSDFPMSVSYGVYYVAKDSNITPKEVMRYADEKMYTLKKRNKLSR